MKEEWKKRERRVEEGLLPPVASEKSWRKRDYLSDRAEREEGTK